MGFRCAECGKAFVSPILMRRHVAEDHAASASLALAPLIQQEPARHPQANLANCEPLADAELQQLVTSALELHEQGNNQSAQQHLYTAAHSARAIRHPQEKQIWYFLGVVRNVLGEHEQACEAYMQAVTLDPRFANAQCNLGRSLDLIGQHALAVAHLRVGVEAEPQNAACHCNLSSALKSNGNYCEAEVAAREACRICPDMPEGLINLGEAISSTGRFGEALEPLLKARELRPDLPAVHKILGSVYKGLNQSDAAISSYEESLRLDPSQVDVSHVLAGLRGESRKMAPVEYTESLFDAFAVRYDTEMVQTLSYQVPDMLKQLVDKVRRFSGVGLLNVLDLGCGTGLGGEVFKSLAHQMIGCDLSGKMLDIARSKGIYTSLKQGELVAVLQAMAEQRESVELIIACDVMCYIGELDEVFRAVRQVLSARGLFGFSVEALDDANCGEEYVLKQTGRYGHSTEFIRQCAARHGLQEARLESAMLRTEGTGSITGTLVVLRKFGDLDDEQDELPELVP